MTVITLPTRQHQNPEALLAAAFEWASTAMQLEAVEARVRELENRRRSLAAAAAAHLVREAHPTADRIVFAVRDGRLRCLHHVLDAEGRYLPARRTGEWAERVLATVINEDFSSMSAQAGVVTTTETLSINIALVEASLAVSEDVAGVYAAAA